MATLLDEHALEIMAFLPTFEDRWQLSLVSWRWRGVYRLLLRPYNDGLASQHLDLPLVISKEESRGPAFTDGKELHWLLFWVPSIAIRFDFQGDHVVEQFGLDGMNNITIYKDSRHLTIFRLELEHYPWMLEYGRKDKYLDGGYLYRKIELPNPCRDGDVFDQVSRALAAFSFENASPEELDNILPDEAWWKSIRFDPTLARRLYHFPYFAREEKRRRGGRPNLNRVLTHRGDRSESNEEYY